MSSITATFQDVVARLCQFNEDSDIALSKAESKQRMTFPNQVATIHALVDQLLGVKDLNGFDDSPLDNPLDGLRNRELICEVVIAYSDDRVSLSYLVMAEALSKLVLKVETLARRLAS